jgi:hypothetical protein
VRAPRTERYGLESTSPRGPGASEALIGPELAISLDDVTILDWIQAIQIFAKQAIITVLHAESESRIWCSQGAVIDASSGRLRGEAAFYRIASIERGRVLTELRPVHRERTIRTSPTWLLLEAARRKDERAQLERKLGGLDRFFHCPEDGVLSRSLNTAQTALLRLFDRPRRLADVVIQSEIGDIETLAALDGLVRSGQLVEAAASSDEPDTGLSVRGEPAHGADSTAAPIASAWPQTSTPSSRSSRWAASTLATGLLVAGAAWFGARASIATLPAAAAPPPYSIAVRTDPVEAELRVDGQFAGRGAWAAKMPRDGSAHELLVSADGFAPVRVIFVDTPPPLEVKLEPQPTVLMPTAEVAEPAAPQPEDRVSPIDAAPAPRAPAQRRKRVAPASGARGGNPAPPSTKAHRPAKKQPFVQIIDADERTAPPNPS